MMEAASIRFIDQDTSDEAYVFIRYDESHVAIGLSLRSDGDMEVFMSKEEARRVLEALRLAVGET